MVKVVKLQSSDGDLFEIEDPVVAMCATVKNMLKGKTAFKNSLGGQFSIEGSYVILKKEGRVLASLIKNTDEEAIVSLPEVKSSTLEKVLDYCRFHNQLDLNERERKSWDADFVQVKQSVLCELASASYYLDIKPLVNLTSRAIASQISGKTSEEIRETFCNINCDVYAPFFASSLAMRCRLQRKFNQKKQLLDKENASKIVAIDDNRSVDQLLEFIEDSSKKNGSSKKKTTKPKKKKEKKKLETSSHDQNSNSAGGYKDDESPDEKRDESSSSGHSPTNSIGSSKDFELQEEIFESDEEMDPKMKADLDKEVEEFRQRLESMNIQKERAKVPVSVSTTFASSMVGVH